MKIILTKLAITFISLMIFSLNIKADVDNDLKLMKENLPYLMESNNVGTLFYLTFHPCWEESGKKNYIRIYVTSSVKTIVTLEIKSLGIYRMKETLPNDVIEFILSPNEALPYSKGDPIPPQPEQVWEDRSIKISSDAPIIVYGIVRFEGTSDGYLAYPVSSFGKEYQVASYADPSSSSQYLPSYTSIVAAYDNTKVTFKLGGCESCRVPTEGGDTIRTGETIKRTLNEGDVWLIPGVRRYNDLTGSKVIASKPVAVISGNFCAYIPSHIQACDYIIEQELPENIWGTKYHVTPISGRKRFSIIKIFAKKPRTQVFADGVPMWNIESAGGILGTGYLETRAGVEPQPRPVVIHSDKEYPINVVQYNTGSKDDSIGTDPFQMQLVPVEQYQKSITFNTPGIRGSFGFRYNFINVVYKATQNGGIPDDLLFGEVVEGKVNWMPLNVYQSNPGKRFAFDQPDTNNRYYYSKTIVLPYDGVFKLKGNEPFTAYSYGYSSFDSYGYPASTGTSDLESGDTLKPYLEFAKSCDGFVAGRVIDEPKYELEKCSKLAKIYMDESSNNYKLSVDEFIVGEDNTTDWALEVIDKSKDANALVVFVDRVGNRKDTVINHFALNPSILEENADFGKLKLTENPNTKSYFFTLVNNSSREITSDYSVYVTLDSKVAQDKPSDFYSNQYFEIIGLENINLAPLGINHEIKFEVMFTAKEIGNYRDSIGIIVIDNSTKDTCYHSYFTMIESLVGEQFISADDYDFPKTVIGNSSIEVTLQIKNIIDNNHKPSVPLYIYGYKISGDQTKLDSIFKIEGLDNISYSNPLIINPGQAYQFYVSFKPAELKDYFATIEFIADSKTPDNITKLSGLAIESFMVISGTNFKKKRVDPNSYKKEEGPYQFDPYPSTNNAITIKNIGTSELRLKQTNIVNNLYSKGYAFLVEYNGFKVPLIENLKNVFNNVTLTPGQERTFNVFFHPKESGQHELELEFIDEDSVTSNCVLTGYGTYPKSETDDLVFPKFMVGTTKKSGSIRFSNSNWTSEDTMTIADFKVEVDGNTTFGEFGSQEIFRWDRSNIQDRNGNVVNFPIRLAPGDFVTINGEFDPSIAGDYVGRLISVSDAEQESISNWSGTANFVEIELRPAEASTCQNQAIELRPTITNISSIDMEIIGFSLENSNNVFNYNRKDFVIQLPISTVIAPGKTIEIPISFLPNGIYLPSSVIVLKVKTAGTGTNKDITREDSTNLTINATFDYFNSKASIKIVSQKNNEKVSAGTLEGVKYTISLNRNKEISTSYGKEITVKVIYKLDFLGLSYTDQERTISKIVLSQEILSLGFQIVNSERKVNRETNEEVLTVNLAGNSSLVIQSGNLDLFSVTFDVYFPYYRDDQGNIQLKENTTEISHLINPNDPCFEVIGDKATVELDATCVDELRPIQISENKYNLGQISPNPVGSKGGEIKFSVGGSNIPTDIRIYNSESKLVGILFSGTLNSGEYSVRIPIESMNSGVYFYEISSGPFYETKKMVVQK